MAAATASRCGGTKEKSVQLAVGGLQKKIVAVLVILQCRLPAFWIVIIVGAVKNFLPRWQFFKNFYPAI
jgi:hypothetical protein